MNVHFRRYAQISKIEPQEDGTLKVYGFASSGAEDSDGEVVTPDAMKAALPDYMKFGAVREMHQNIAAGTAIEASVEDDGKTSFGAHVVDPIAVKKVTAGVYKGFSIGGKVLERSKANQKEITKLKLVEVSLVDRPANPEAIFTMYKVETDEPAKPDAPIAAVAGTEPSKEDSAAKAAPAAAVAPAPAAAAPAATPEPTTKTATISDDDKALIGEIGGILNKGELSPKDLLAAARAAIAKVKAGPRAKVEPKKLQKGMGGLANFAGLLQSLAWLAQDCEGEAAWEGDSSPVPMQLRDWLATGVMIFENMATEETNEMLAALKPQVEVVAAAAAAETQKAGAKFSTATKKALGDIHKAMIECCDKMDGLGYKTADDAAEQAEQPGDLLKAATLAADALLKAELAKRDATIASLEKRLLAIEAQPMPPKGALRAVGKGDDATPTTKVDDPLPDSATPEQRTHHELVKVFKTGGVPVLGRRSP